MNFLVSVVPTLLVLGVLITIHEFGHFVACRLSGVNVEKFSIGFGPEILRVQRKNTWYVLSLFPLGGYVKPAGESYSELPESGPKAGDYLAAALPKRIFIVCAGVLMNYLLAFVLFGLIFMMGRPVPGTTIGGFVEGYPAQASGLLKGDKIVAVNHEPVSTWTQMTGAFEKIPGPEITLQVERGGEAPVDINVTPKEETVPDIFGKPVKVKRIGITPSPEANQFERYPFLEAYRHSAETTWFLTKMTHKSIFYLILGKISMKAISGPVGIISMTGDAAKLGLPYVLQLMATLSISLAVINLLPVPALDGGHLLFLLIEGVRRKKVSLVVQERVTQVGFALLLALMVFLIYNDLANIDAFDKIRGIFIKP
ncbi:MAG TPA: RIP metalloprotease RseP [Verrucomicrobiae bacterium]|nr:RIP metalloprotease RseP [Verrucomicrobiae bacterium]